MTEHDYRLQRAKILRELETAEHLGCKRVIADCKHRLQKLETQRFQEAKVSLRYDTPDFETVVNDDALLPTMKFIVTFENGKKMEMETYHKPAIGLKRSDIERDFVTSFNATQFKNAPKILKAHYIPLRGGRKSDFELACQRISERFEAMRIAQRYRREEAICNNS